MIWCGLEANNLLAQMIEFFACAGNLVTNGLFYVLGMNVAHICKA